MVVTEATDIQRKFTAGRTIGLVAGIVGGITYMIVLMRAMGG